MAEDTKGGGLSGLLKELPVDRLKDEGKGMFSALSEKAMGNISDRVSNATGQLSDFASGDGVMGQAAKGGAEGAMGEDGSAVGGALKGGLTGVKDKVKDKIPGLGGGGGKGGDGGKPGKSVNIIEYVDVGVPISVACNQWTQWQDYSGFTRKVEDARAEEENKIKFKAQIVWSHRTWTGTITEQVPDRRIVWKSEGEKGHVDGAVTFHELGPELTRIIMVLEYYPQGLFERTGNIWRAQGRRARSDLKHYVRHTMTRAILHPDELEGLRTEIHDKEIVREHDQVVEDEEENGSRPGPYDEYEEWEPEDEEEDSEQDEEPEDGEGEDGEGEPEDEYEDEESEEEEPEDEEPAEEEPEDEYEEPAEEEELEEEPAEEEPEDEYEEPAEEESEEEESEEEPAEEEPEDEYEEPAEEEELEEEEPAEEEPEDEYEDEDAAEDEPAEEERPKRRRRAKQSA